MARIKEAQAYIEMKERHQRDFDELPLMFAFDRKQFEQGLEKRGWKEDQVVSMGCGGYATADGAKVIMDALKHHADELTAAMEDPEFAYGAFLYEMVNHEYSYNYDGDWDVLKCFYSLDGCKADGFDNYANYAGMTHDAMNAYVKARKRYYELCGENGWW